MSTAQIRDEVDINKFLLTGREQNVLKYLTKMMVRNFIPFQMSSGNVQQTSITLVSKIFEIGDFKASGKPENSPVRLGSANYMSISITSKVAANAASVATITPYIMNGDEAPRTIADMSALSNLNFLNLWNTDKAFVLQDYVILSRFFAFKLTMTLDTATVIDTLCTFR